MNYDLIQIKQLKRDDAVKFQTLRLEALQNDPDAFGSTFEEENERPLTWFEEWIEKSAVFGAFHDGQLLGVAGLYAQQGLKRAHIGALRTMYVQPFARKAAIGKKLVMAIIEFSNPLFELIHLGVGSKNVAAIRLYKSCGFVEYAVKKQAFKQNGQYIDEVMMAKNVRT